MPITSALIQQYQHPRFRVVVGNITIEETDIIANSFTYKSGTSAGGAFAPGGCVVSQCSFAVRNGSGQHANTFTDGAEVLVYVGYGASVATATYDLLCTVYVAEVSRRSGRITVTCHDALRKADKKKWTTYAFPMTVNQIITSAATEAGIAVNQLPTDGGTISVDLRDDDGNQPNLGVTCRQAIANALLISGNFGLMTANGQLSCGWYSRTATASIDISWLFDYEIADSDAYTGVQVAGQAVTGSDASLYVLSSNAFLTENNKVAVQARLYTALVGFQVPKISVSAILNPSIRPGMTVSLSYPQSGTTMTAIFPLMDLSAHGGMLASYSSSNISADVRDDKRTSQREANEAVARGDYATKQYVDDAVASGGGGGGGGDESPCCLVMTKKVVLYIPSSGWSRDFEPLGKISGWKMSNAAGNVTSQVKQYAGTNHTVIPQLFSVPAPADYVDTSSQDGAKGRFTIRLNVDGFYGDIPCVWAPNSDVTPRILFDVDYDTDDFSTYLVKTSEAGVEYMPFNLTYLGTATPRKWQRITGIQRTSTKVYNKYYLWEFY